MAEEIPTTDNGGISSDGKTYTIKMRSGIKWNTSPSRPVTAEDFVRGVKRTCNPIQPFGGSTNYTTLIEGMEKFCADFAELGADATPADLTKFIDSNELPGVVAKDDSTIVIKLVRPAAYFADMLALAAFSPAPVEVMKYMPGSAELGKNQVARRSVQDRQVRPDQVHRAEPQPRLGRLDRPGPQGLRRQDLDRRDR